jgi:hypothetical protein
MRVTAWGIEFTCDDLIEAGVMFGCCPACHGHGGNGRWDESSPYLVGVPRPDCRIQAWGCWPSEAEGLLDHVLSNGARVVCCCGYPSDKPDRWVIGKLAAWRRRQRRARQRPARKRRRAR